MKLLKVEQPEVKAEAFFRPSSTVRTFSLVMSRSPTEYLSALIYVLTVYKALWNCLSISVNSSKTLLADHSNTYSKEENHCLWLSQEPFILVSGHLLFLVQLEKLISLKENERKHSNIFHDFHGKTSGFITVYFLPGFSWTLYPTCKQCGLGGRPQWQSSHIYWRAVMKEQRVILLYETHSHVPSQYSSMATDYSHFLWRPLEPQRGHETRQEKMSELPLTKRIIVELS